MTPYALLALPLQVRSKPRMSPSCHSQNPGGPLTDMGWEMLSCRGHGEVESTEGLRIPDCGQGAAFLGSPCPDFTFSVDHGCLDCPWVLRIVSFTFSLIILFFFFRLCWIFIAARRLPPVVASRDTL